MFVLVFFIDIMQQMHKNSSQSINMMKFDEL